MKKNVDISKAKFAERLKVLREHAGLSRTDLAAKAGVSSRTILDLERNRRQRVQEKTLLLIAEALGVNRYELLSDTRSAKPETLPNERARSSFLRYRRVLTLGVMAAVVFIGFLFFREHSIANARIEADGRVISARAAFFGTIWSQEHDSSVMCFATTPWRGRKSIAYGLDAEGSDGGKLIVRELNSGKMLWQSEPDFDEIAIVFNQELARTGDYRCKDIRFVDIDGDDEPELLAYFAHHKWFPSALILYEQNGTRIGAYYHWGHLFDFHVEDIDEDGKQEILVGGTNNAKAYRGATLFLLDDTHCSGASVDSIAQPVCAIADSAFARVVFPQFDQRFMDLQAVFSRINATDIRVSRGHDGKHVITTNVGTPKFFVIVTLDENLRPLDVSISDEAILQTRSWPEEARQSFLSGYLNEWLAQHYYFSEARPGL